MYCLLFHPNSGLDLWKRNLQLLVPFLVEPTLDLISLKRLGKLGEQGEEVLKVRDAWLIGGGSFTTYYTVMYTGMIIYENACSDSSIVKILSLAYWRRWWGRTGRSC